MQFHPTTLYPTGILLTEGCRGEGAYLHQQGRRALHEALRAERARARLARRRLPLRADGDRRGPRHRRQRDARHAPPRRGADPRAAARLARALDDVYAGIDPIYDPVPVRPGAHYHMGGVETDNDGATELTGLYAAGECACVSVHGANRLGGNSLMETITFGRRAGRAAAEWALSHTTIDVPESAERDAEREAEGAARPHGRRAPVADPRGARRRRCSRTSPSSAARSRWRSRSRSSTDLRERYKNVVRRGQGRRLQQRPDAGDRARQHARHRALHGHRRPRAQGEPRRARAAARLSRRATTRTSCTTRSRAGRTAASSCRQADVRFTKWEPQERKY